MEEIAKEFFKNLFSSQTGVIDRDHILSGVHQCISKDDNMMLMTPYRADEVVQALKCMGSTKTPGMDGFLALFSKILGYCRSKRVSLLLGGS